MQPLRAAESTAPRTMIDWNTMLRMRNVRSQLNHRHENKWERASHSTARKGWKDLFASVHVSAVMTELEMKARIKEGLRRAPNTVVTTVSNRTELAATPFSQQGNTALYLDSVIDLRSKLRHNARIVAELQRWWYTALRSRRAPRAVAAESATATASVAGEPSASAAAAGVDDSPPLLDKIEHMGVIVRVSRATLQDWSMAEARQIAHEDWRSDSRGSTKMGREMFMDAIFELADLWQADDPPARPLAPAFPPAALARKLSFVSACVPAKWADFPKLS